jgi:AcrR family transcriptional regulator
VSSLPIADLGEDLGGRGAQARQALVSAAVEVFGESGLEAATTREIAQRARQNIAAIAYYFGGKEGLYRAVAEHIVQVILTRIGPLMDEVEGFLAQPQPAPRRCIAYLQELLALSIATNQSMVPLTGIIVREQIHPTRAFAILYQGCLERLQRLGAALIHAYLGERAAEHECIVRFHALLGESLAFRFARETILRRAGWKHVGAREESLIRAVVTEHAALVLRGLKRNFRRNS